MLFYLALFLAFLYFKIARVHKKEEILTRSIKILHILTGAAITAILVYGTLYIEWYFFVPFIFIFATMASLMVTTVQLGIFVDGKPLLGIGRVYTFFPLFSVSILFFSSLLWISKISFI